MNEIHFIRPEWFLAFIPLIILWWFFYKKSNLGNSWFGVVDKHLLSRLTTQNIKYRKSYLPALVASIFILVVFALSGPSFYKQSIPVYKMDKLQVILLDTSPSMIASDVKPSRLKRGILLVKQLLKQDKQSETMLVAFSAEPYLISPPTTDDKAILNLLQGLDTSTLPKKGSRLDLALIYVRSLLAEYSNKKVNILLFTDAQDVRARAFDVAKEFKKKNQYLSIIAIAKDNAANFKNEKGEIKFTKLNQKLLNLLAKTGGGLYQLLGSDTDSIKTYLNFSKNRLSEKTKKQEDKNIKRWVDSGIYLVLILLPLTLLLFRRGYFMVFFIFILPLQVQDSCAKEPNMFNTMWQTTDQLAKDAFLKNQYEESARLFSDENWRASALYKAKDYENAAKLFKKLGQNYNYANALAKQKQFQEAIDIYNKIDKNNVNYQNAKHNLSLLKKILDNQKQQKESQQGKNNQKQQKENQQAKSNQEQQKENQQKQQEDKNQKQQTASNKDKEKNDKNTSEKNKQQKSKKTKDGKEKSDEQDINTKNKQKQAEKQRLEQIFKQVETRPIDLLKQKFLIERYFREKQNSDLINKENKISW